MMIRDGAGFHPGDRFLTGLVFAFRERTTKIDDLPQWFNAERG
jgi:hypothetical protein